MPRRPRPSHTDSDDVIADYLTNEEEEEDSQPLPSPRNERSFRGDMTKPTNERTTSMIDPTEWELEDSQEPYALKDGSEVMVRILEVRKARRDNDAEYYIVRYEIPSEPYSKEVTDFLDIPSRSLDAKRLNAARQRMLHFTQCFNIDVSRPFEPMEDWPGQEGWCLLSMSKSEQYGEQNRVARYLHAR